MDHCAADAHLLFHPCGKLSYAFVYKIMHLQEVIQVCFSFFQLIFLHPVELPEIVQDLVGCQALIEPGSAGEEAHFSPCFSRFFIQVDAADLYLAGGGFQDGCDDAQSGGFSGPVGPQEAEHASGLAGKMHVIQHAEVFFRGRPFLPVVFCLGGTP